MLASKYAAAILAMVEKHGDMPVVLREKNDYPYADGYDQYNTALIDAEEMEVTKFIKTFQYRIDTFGELEDGVMVLELMPDSRIGRRRD